MSVRIEKGGPVFTVVLSRPAVRNAVDAPTAEALADAFHRFAADAEARETVAGASSFVSGAGRQGVFGTGTE